MPSDVKKTCVSASLGKKAVAGSAKGKSKAMTVRTETLIKRRYFKEKIVFSSFTQKVRIYYYNIELLIMQLANSQRELPIIDRYAVIKKHKCYSKQNTYEMIFLENEKYGY